MKIKFLPLILILLLTKFILAQEAPKFPSLNSPYSKFNLQGAIGLNRGARIGLQYRLHENFSFDLGYGFIPFIGGIVSLNTNYHKNLTKGLILSLGYEHILSYSYKGEIITSDIGYTFYNPDITVFSLTFRLGVGAGVFQDKIIKGYRTMDWYVIPDFDITLGVQY